MSKIARTINAHSALAALLRRALILGILLLLNTVVRVHHPRPLLPCPLPSAALAPYSPSSTADFVTLREGQFYAGNEPFFVRGVNYYPSRAPWRRFLTTASIDDVRLELDLLRDAGLNTLRIFLWYEPLFACDGAVPVAQTFTRLDNIIHEAASRGFRLIVTLNDLPDLREYPLYSDPLHVRLQTGYIVQRYREERAILAWDMRNEGDIDYGSNNLFGGGFARPDVLRWLQATAAYIRRLDSRHLLTAGWLYDSWSTAGAVDFVSFHHWENAQRLHARIAEIRRHTDKPILLQEFGYSTYRVSPDEQARLIEAVIQSAEENRLLGWLIWAAFDFPLDATCLPSPCVSADNAEHHFGLWYADYRAKPAVAVLTRR
jgi:hypothetical protein